MFDVTKDQRLFNALCELAREVECLNYTLNHPEDRDHERIINARKQNTADALQNVLDAVSEAGLR